MLDHDSSAPLLELSALRAENARLREERTLLEQKIVELQEGIAARDTFVEIAGHELRNPMSTLLVATTTLAHRLAASGGEVTHSWLLERLALIERQARGFIRRATTLLDVSQIRSGHLRLEREQVDFTAVVRDALDVFAHEMQLAKSTLTTSLAPSVVGWWDPVALEQIVSNLVQNATKYGAGAPIHVSLDADSAAERVTFSVADRGIGISPADRERIFSRFERAVARRAHGGFGLGLWITRQLVDALDGEIRVQSEPGSGSIFTVELPWALKQAPQ